MQRLFSKFLSVGIVVLILFLIDLYVFQSVRIVSQTLPPAVQRIMYVIYWAVFVVTAATFVLISVTRGAPPSAFQTYLASTLFIIFASKLVVVVFLMLDDVLRLGKVALNSAGNEAAFDPSRSKFLSQLGLVVAAVPLTAFIWGMVKGAYEYRVKHITLRFPNLPQAFDGYKMLQISDLHTGSFTSTDPLKEAVQLINQQHADIVFFTGDLVNNMAVEVQQHIDTLGGIKAKTAVFSVLGNHDYGDYVAWPGPEVKRKNLLTLIDSHGKMGWDILMNEHRIIEKDGEHIAILGVENWGNKAGFPKYGRLNKAYAGAAQAPFKVLLSHDPSHWDGEVNQQYQDIDLTLSGHTHGMQFGINIPGWKWSPVQYMYRQWAGLYKKGNQYLYVNTGLGFLGYPGRVGFLPEITVFELKRA
ncbi:metallophosphoesterase [Pontibacter sp. 172403-2]|uniref:metallophosphoesterase n=1 Tax=Pontibacter rufus TaxID=2791028 RepID=UPI0018AF5F29|nr:metallophosphoesterase [Pontibacter sp. 172403-2]MBF9251981.1 metallophosphoesterase [Pontibacter sp. 172403-2]